VTLRSSFQDSDGGVAVLEYRLRSWKWRPTPRELSAAVEESLARAVGTEDLERRTALGDEMRRMAIRVWQRQGLASSRKYLWHIGMRVMPAAAAIAASAAGGTLIGGLKGTSATVVGAVAIGLAAIGAAGAALRLDSEFVYQGERSKALEEIGWSLLTSITLDLPYAEIDVLRARITGFETRIAEAVNRPLPRDQGTEPRADERVRGA